MTLRQSTSCRALFERFPPLARVLNWLPAPMQKGVFLGFFTRSCLQGNESSCSEGCHESGFKSCHYSQVTEWALQLCGMGNCRDGEKLLCNRCPLKHEAQKRERGEMLYENVSNWKHRHQKTCVEKYNWYLWYICGMGAAIHNRVCNNPDPRHGRSHPVRIGK